MPKCPRIDAKDILIASLKRLGADGLCCDGCGCGLDDLVCCNNDPSACVPARKTRAKGIDPGECGAADYDLGPDDDYYVEMDIPADVQASALGIASNAKLTRPAGTDARAEKEPVAGSASSDVLDATIPKEAKP